MDDGPGEKPSVRARNKMSSTFEPAVNMNVEEWPGQAIDLGDPGEEPDTASVLPDKRDPGFMDAVLHSLYSGIGNLRVLDMSEAKLVCSLSLRFSS